METASCLNNERTMKDVGIAIVAPFKEPPKDAKLVIFANNRPYVPFYDARKMLASCAAYAAKYNVYVVPEKFSLEDYLCLTLLDPEGRPMGIQRACHLTMSDRGVFQRDDELEPIDTPFGRVVLLPSVDMNIPYVRNLGVLKGAELFIASLFMESYDFSSQRAMLYAMNMAQTTSVPVACAIGNGGMIVNGDWTLSAPFDVANVYGRVTPSQNEVDKLSLKKGTELLNKYKKLFVEENRSKEEE